MEALGKYRLCWNLQCGKWRFLGGNSNLEGIFHGKQNYLKKLFDRTLKSGTEKCIHNIFWDARDPQGPSSPMLSKWALNPQTLNALSTKLWAHLISLQGGKLSGQQWSLGRCAAQQELSDNKDLAVLSAARMSMQTWLKTCLQLNVRSMAVKSIGRERKWERNLPVLQQGAISASTPARRAADLTLVRSSETDPPAEEKGMERVSNEVEE